MLAPLSYRAADALVGLLPPRAADGLARLLARAVFAFHPPARSALEANLARLLPEAPPVERRRRARASFEHFALSFVDFLRLPRLSREAFLEAVSVRGREHLEAARASGRGVLVLSAHVGCWEWGAAWLGAAGVPLALAARAHPGAVERLFAGRRAAFGVRALPTSRMFAGAASALRRGEWVGVMADRSADPQANRGSVCAWAAILARRTNALVLPALMVRERGGRHTLVLEPALSPAECREGALRDRLRIWIARHPEQWAAFEPLPEGLA